MEFVLIHVSFPSAIFSSRRWMLPAAGVNGPRPLASLQLRVRGFCLQVMRSKLPTPLQQRCCNATDHHWRQSKHCEEERRSAARLLSRISALICMIATNATMRPLQQANARNHLPFVSTRVLRKTAMARAILVTVRERGEFEKNGSGWYDSPYPGQWNGAYEWGHAATKCI